MKETYASFYPADPITGGIKAINRRVDFVRREAEPNEGKGAEEASGWFYTGFKKRLPEAERLAIMRHYADALMNVLLWQSGKKGKNCPVVITRLPFDV